MKAFYRIDSGTEIPMDILYAPSGTKATVPYWPRLITRKESEESQAVYGLLDQLDTELCFTLEGPTILSEGSPYLMAHNVQEGLELVAMATTSARLTRVDDMYRADSLFPASYESGRLTLGRMRFDRNRLEIAGLERQVIVCKGG